MAQMGRPGLSPEGKSEVWRRWRAGESLLGIGKALDKPAGSIYGVIRLCGGYTPTARKRSLRALTLSEREDISRGVSAGLSIRAIARQLNRAPSTISREIARNGGTDHYRALEADERALQAALRPKCCLLEQNRRLRYAVERKLCREWSPEQVSGWLKNRYPDDEAMRVSHETIYRSLFVQTRGVLKKELQYHLRTQRKMRHSRSSSTKGARNKIADAVSIHERPTEAADRAVPGHWEGDLVSGANNTHVATLVERRSRFTIIVKVKGKDTVSVVAGLKREVKRLPQHLRKSLTWDRGMELASHKDFTIATDVKVYFCDPRSPWQRGTNENTNRLLRQYLPHGTQLDQYSQAELNKIAARLNERPRKTLGFMSPADKLCEAVAATR
ncbi:MULTISPECIES: IS30 family transposase [unclassified Burkholderia]|nr:MULTISPECIES: IS30 family transposase [unclassified Burkholderia]TWC62158.1 IS30 family transposase [Burkholderia sp. SJZ089]TWC95543.1 IS30 family transposase [Burkholderia sp. SJZ115]TWC98881.1 IS30 family transposase [Burkholderia sp. SJZ091]